MNIEGRKRFAGDNELSGTFVFLTCVAAEYTGGSKFAELVTDHVFGNIYGDEFVAIMNGDRQTYEIRGDHRCAGPSFDSGLFARFLRSDYALFKFIVYIWTFF